MNKLKNKLEMDSERDIGSKAFRKQNDVNKISNSGNGTRTCKSKNLFYFEDIIMVKAESNYSKLFLKNGKSLLTSKTLKHWQIHFGSSFIRCHASYLINISHIVKIDKQCGSILLQSNILAKISRRKNAIIDENLLKYDHFLSYQ